MLDVLCACDSNSDFAVVGTWDCLTVSSLDQCKADTIHVCICMVSALLVHLVASPPLQSPCTILHQVCVAHRMSTQLTKYQCGWEQNWYRAATASTVTPSTGSPQSFLAEL